MITNRLKLALERLQPSDWHRFEKLASAFLASEFDDLRTTASPSGDEGRDSELLAPEAEPKVLLQYSVSADWASKIHRTAALAETDLLAAISVVSTAILSTHEASAAQEAALTQCIRAATDAVLLERSQAFAMAVQTGSLAGLVDADFTEVLLAEVSRSSLPKMQGVEWLVVLRAGVGEVLLSEDPAVQAHMRSLADAYTLLAFLRQTPDVQGAVEKMFSHGQVWLDASVVLPLLAEPLFDGPPGRFTRMLEAARDAGLELFVTPGALEEIERHMNRALTCVRMDDGGWLGSVPYLLERYVASGQSPAAFANWLENFRGDVRPEQDIGDYLLDQFGIGTRSLEAERDAAAPELRHALQAL